MFARQTSANNYLAGLLTGTGREHDAKLPDVCPRASTSVTSPVMIVEVLPIILIFMTIKAERGKRFDLLGHKAR